MQVVCFSDPFDTTFECDPRQPADLGVGPAAAETFPPELTPGTRDTRDSDRTHVTPGTAVRDAGWATK